MPARALDLRGYETFAAALRTGRFTAPADPDSWSAELVAAHVIADNDFWTATARDVGAGGTPTYGNEPAVDFALLAKAVMRLGGTLDELANEVLRSAGDLAAAYAALSDAQAARPVRVRGRDHDDSVVDEPRPIAAVLERHASVHLQRHLDQLLDLRDANHEPTPTA